MKPEVLLVLVPVGNRKMGEFLRREGLRHSELCHSMCSIH